MNYQKFTLLALYLLAPLARADLPPPSLLGFAHRSEPGGWGLGATIAQPVWQRQFGGLVIDAGPSLTYSRNEFVELWSLEQRIYAVYPLPSDFAVYAFVGGGLTHLGGNNLWTLSRGTGISWRSFFADLSWYDDRTQTKDFRMGVRFVF